MRKNNGTEQVQVQHVIKSDHAVPYRVQIVNENIHPVTMQLPRLFLNEEKCGQTMNIITGGEISQDFAVPLLSILNFIELHTHTFIRENKIMFMFIEA